MNGRWTAPALHAGFFLLLAASAARLIVRHGLAESTLPLVLCGVLAIAYGIGVIAGERAGVAWLAGVLAVWLALVLTAPSFAFCAIPLFVSGVRLLQPRALVVTVAVLTAAVIFAQLRLADRFDPSLVLAPVAVAAMATVIVVDLRRTRNELDRAQRDAGVLAERERLAREIHDTIAQGLTSVGILLQAADQAWGTDAGRAHVRRAADAATANLAEARRFVRDLAPVALDAGPLPDALRRLAGASGLDVEVRTVGDPRPLPDGARAAVVRVVQAALGNVREHAGTRRAVVTVTYTDRALAVDVVDDGTGFDPAAVAPGGGRGYGLGMMRARLAEVGGTLTVESAPGRGTALAATIELGDAT